jgi:hypothetical protein
MCLAGCSNSSSPSSGTGGAPCGSGATCPAAPPTPPAVAVEIEINNTPATTDDLVQLKCDHPAHRHKTPCRIRVKGTAPGPVFIVLTNPDGRLRFPDAADTTRSLTLPANGGWVPFEISGETGSSAIGDAKIEAHENTASGPVRGTKDATVFWFDQAEIKITVGGSYAIAGGRYTVTGAHAVDYSAKARIRPAGVDCSAPQVRDLRIGILQNTNSAVHVTNWGNPTIAWNPGVAAGTTVNVPATVSLTFTLPRVANDTAASVAPLYDQPGKAQTLSANSLKPPIGCTGGASATTHDTPSQPAAPATVVLPASTAAGVVVGNATYPITSVTLRDDFTTWTVVFNTATNDVCTLRQRGWTLNANSTAAAQQATPAAADAAPSTTPVTTGADAVTLFNASRTVTQSGSTRFVR